MRDTHLSRVLSQHGLKLVDFAGLIGVDKSTVSRWSASRVPADRLAEIEARTGIERASLRPDLYPSTPAPSPHNDGASITGGADARA